MVDSTPASGNQVQRWSDSFFVEWLRSTQFSSHMGTSEESVIQVIENLMKESGDRITVSMVTRLTGAGVEGDDTLEGNEEDLDNYSHQITVNQVRNAVRVARMAQMRTNIDFMKAAKPALKGWLEELTRDKIIAALMSPNVDGKTAYADCSEAQKDAWLVANADRILFGSAKANSGSDHSAALSNVDSTDDKMSPGVISLAKRMAKLLTTRKIRPLKVDGAGELLILYTQSYAFRDLKNDSNYTTYLRDAEMRGKNNPLFQDGDLYWDGVLIREIPEIPVISGVGASSIDVAPNFLCGAQTVGVAFAQRSKFEVEERDYKNKRGVAVGEVRGIEKLMFNSVQNCVTIYTSGVADS